MLVSHAQREKAPLAVSGRFLKWLIPVFMLGLLSLYLSYIQRIPKLSPSQSTPEYSYAPIKACSSSVKSDPLVALNGTRTVVITPYLEHRSKEREIRTIAIVQRNENVIYRCLLCCNNQLFPTKTTYSIHSDHFGFDYGTADILCPVPAACATPSHLFLSSAGRPSDTRINAPLFIPIQNLHSRNTSFPYEFTVCISTMYNYNNVLQLVQTLEMFRLLGVQRVAIYKISCTDAIQKILDYYVQKDFVEVIPWPVTSYFNVSKGWKPQLSPGDLHYYGQIPALNDCVYRYMYQSHYVALQDLDELILPLVVDSWSELLPQLEKAHGYEVGFEFENHLFPSTISELQPHYKPPQWQGVPGVNILEHIYHTLNNPFKSSNFKVIVNPRLVFSTTVHGLLDSVGSTVRVSPNIARIYHIRAPGGDTSKNTYAEDNRVQDYASRLIPAVAEVLEEAFKSID